MEWWLVGTLVFVLLFGLLATGIPIGFVFGITAVVVGYLVWGDAGLAKVAATSYGTTAHFLLIALPLFVFMGELMAYGGVTKAAFESFEKWIGRLPGGLAISSLFTCTVFAAVTGFSPAATALIGTVTVPEMLKRGYSPRLATGTVAAGSALAILIPPGILMIMYAYIAEVSVAKMFIGGIIPGLMIAFIFMVYVYLRVRLNPSLAPLSEKRFTWREKAASFPKLLPVLLIIGFVLGSIYFGIGTPTEAGALGSLGALALGLAARQLGWRNFVDVLRATVRITSMVFLILIGATVISQILAFSGFTEHVAGFIIGMPVPSWVVIIAIMVVLTGLGMFMDAASILFITGPIFVPVVVGLGFNPVWYGILFVINMELANITPPIGLNLFVMKGIAPPEVTMGDIIAGCMPFWGLYWLAMVLVIIFPVIILWLPSLMS